MIEGIEILSQTPVYNTYIPEWFSIFVFLGPVFFITFLALAIIREKIIYFLLSLVCIISAAVLPYLALTGNPNDINYIEYKVYIEDNVSYNDFMEKYEILDQEGKIYTIKER